jgi:hypothetical protein
MSTQPMLSPPDPPEGATFDRPANSQKDPRPATLSTSLGLPGRKRVFFHFEIGMRKTITLPGCVDVQAQSSGKQAPAAHTRLGPQRPLPPPPPAADSGAAALLAAPSLAGAGAGTGSAPSLADPGSGSSTSTSAGYFELSVGISTETPPYSGGGPVG